MIKEVGENDGIRRWNAEAISEYWLLDHRSG